MDFLELLLIIAALIVLFSLASPFLFLSMKRRLDALSVEVERLKRDIEGLGGASRTAPPSMVTQEAERGPEGVPDAETSPEEAISDEPTSIAAMSPPPLPSWVQQETEETAPGGKAREKRDLESLLGGSWSVILGGIAVALGALFLVRYSIEAGLLGPAARIAGGAILAAALLAGGEFLRRKDQREDLPPFMSADIPGVLTGAGAIAAFGTLYAAYAIYGFVGPAVAFIGLTLIGLACLLLASVHGPKLAAIGLLGAYAAPLLVSTDEPNYLALALHILVVTASVMAVARIRGWRWLGLGAAIGSLTWMALIALGGDLTSASLELTGLAVGICAILALGFGWSREVDLSQPTDAPGDWISFGVIAAFSVLALPYVFNLETATALVLLSGLIIVAAAAFLPSLAIIAPWAALLTTALAAALQLSPEAFQSLFDDRIYTQGYVPPDIAAYLTSWLIAAVPVSLLALYGAWRSAKDAPRVAGYQALAFALVSLLGLVMVYLRVSNWETSTATAFAATLMAAICVALTEAFTRRRTDDLAAPAPAIFAVAGIGFLALAMGVVFSHVWLPFGMALTAAGTAWVFGNRPLKALPVVVLLLSALAASGLYFNAPFAGAEIGMTPFFNRLIPIVGLPAIMLLLAGHLLRRENAEPWASYVTAIALALLAFFVSLELRHFITGGEIASDDFGLADIAVQSIAALGFAIGLQLVARRSSARIFDQASLVAGAIGILMLIIGLGFVWNPLITDESVGAGRIFNLLLPGYLITALLAAAVAWLARGVRPDWYRYGYGMAAGLLAFLYVTLMVRHGFQGERLAIWWRATSDAEIWTYSVVWLLMGGVVLAAGLFGRSLPLRAASALLILLTVAKVFLIDMSALTGALRAFSFIGLGLALILIGRFYQRILTGSRAQPPDTPDAA